MRGKRFKQIREAHNLSQKAMSELLFYNVSTIGKWERFDKILPTGIEAQLRRMGIDVPLPSWIDDIEPQD